MLKATNKNKSTTTYDIKVTQLASNLCRMWDELEDFERTFKEGISKFPRLNTFVAKNCYRLIKSNQSTIQVWHTNSNSEPDRFLLEVNYTPDF